jgi:hypothetical protein
VSDALRIREHSPAAILAALAVNVVDRLRDLDPHRRIEVLQIAIALTAAEIQQRSREVPQPQDE